MTSLRLLVCAVLLLVPVVARANCENDPDKQDKRNCPHVHCGTYAFSKCATEWCCMWVTDEGIVWWWDSEDDD